MGFLVQTMTWKNLFEINWLLETDQKNFVMADKAPSQILETHGVTTLVHEMKDLPIPNEMLSEILSYVGNKEKLSVSLVNKRWF